MTDKQLDILETNALALRKLADLVLEQVQTARRSAPAKHRKRVNRDADIRTRLLTGRYKPSNLKKS